MTADVRPGSEFAGYRIVSMLGRGGMGEVYLAEDLHLGRKVALKVLPPDLTGDARFRDRFIRESRLAASLEHPNIVAVYEAKESDGVLFLAMRYVDGTDLKTLIATEGFLGSERIISILDQVADALDAAHEQGLVHRDVKPGNVLVATSGQGRLGDRAYLSDFGITKRVSSDSGITATGQFIGTLDYAAPEVFEGKSLDGRADVYSLGCVLYECLTREVPYVRDSEAALIWAHMSAEPPKVTERRPELPAAVDQVVARAMARSPDDRFPTCGDLMTAARAALGQDVRPVVPSRLVLPGRTSRLRSRAGRAWMVAAGIAVVVGVVVVLNLSVGGRRKGATAPGSTSGGPATAAASVYRVDPATGRVQLRAQIGNSADALAIGGGSVWVADRRDNVVVRLDAGTGHEQARIPVAGGPVEIALSDSVPGVWVMTGSAVWRIDPVTNGIAQTIHLDNHPTGIAVGEGAVWVTITEASHGLLRLDPTNGLPRDIGGLFGNLGAAGVATSGGAVWVIGPPSAQAEVSEFDPGRKLFAKVVRLEYPPETIASGDGAVWLLAPSGVVSRLDPKSERSDVIVNAGSGASGVGAGGGSVWVTKGRTLLHVDPQAREVVATIDLKARAIAVAVGDDEVWVTTETS